MPTLILYGSNEGGSVGTGGYKVGVATGIGVFVATGIGVLEGVLTGIGVLAVTGIGVLEGVLTGIGVLVVTGIGVLLGVGVGVGVLSSSEKISLKSPRGGSAHGGSKIRGILPGVTSGSLGPT